MSESQIPAGDPVWRRPGHFDRFEFLNLSAEPQTLTGLHFEFKDKNDVVVCVVDLTNPPITLQINESWEWIPQPDEAYGDAIKFTGYVDLDSGKHVTYDFELEGKPDYTYIWTARLGLQTSPENELVAFGFVEYMAPVGVSLQEGDWGID